MKLEEFKKDYNWNEALAYAPFNMDEVAEILASEEGENDGDSWVAVVKLTDGRFGFIDAGCDYTGWDCRAGGDGFITDTFEELQRWKMNSSARRRLKMELSDLDDVPNRN